MLEERVRKLNPGQRRQLAELLKSRANQKGTVVAFCTLRSGQTVSSVKLRQHVREQLSPAVIPHRFVFVDEFPRTSTGKIDRQAVARLPVDTQNSVPVQQVSADAASGSDRTELARVSDLSTFADSQQSADLSFKGTARGHTVKQKIRALWAEVLGTNDFRDDENFFEAGGDSLGLIRLIALGTERSVSITPGMFHEHPTVDELTAALLQDAAGVPPVAAPLDLPVSHSLMTESTETTASAMPGPVRTAADGPAPLCLSSDDSLSPLFLIPPKGVAVGDFRHVVSHVQDYSCFSPVTFERDSADRLTVDELATRFLISIRRQQPIGPYRLVGTCEGAYIAWEMAQQLTAAGESVELLGIIDTPNPTALTFRPVSDRLRQRWRSLKSRSLLTRPVAFLKRAAHWLYRRSKQVVVGEVHLTRAGSRMGWKFSPKPWSGQATLFRANVPMEETDFDADFTNGWGALPLHGLDVCSLPCHRLQILQPPFAEQLARHIESAIRHRRMRSERSVEA